MLVLWMWVAVGGGANVDQWEDVCFTRSPSALLPLFWGRVPLQKSTTEKQGYPYSILSTGGPSLGRRLLVF